MEQAFTGYSGQAYSPAGDKGRFVLPPLFRKAVKESSGSRILCINKHDRWTCLSGFGLSRKEELERQLDREEEMAFKFGREFDRETRGFQLNAFEEIPFDDSGRFVMPAYLRELANVEDGLFFLGGGRFFTMWTPSELYKMGDEWAAAKAACKALVAEAEAKRK
ncbi:division/cell wall cluster transcriptional repressor MraZ [Erythrobacter sp. SDW2]|uniref:division/cell wall cluster transcriptional repressor MraZ n=1 Tax=Erythrobacter sp. SDW2 TaxID=2907154 RepID=UPI001F3C26AE|nr:division/cell wall cluster transcriptional repressor MraZ [Erythrobacter sp. SDW2]UIP06493.1 division/cell wall cluster transcriptional repressor MraZ [Erythrobacter sp. SDW2]